MGFKIYMVQKLRKLTHARLREIQSNPRLWENKSPIYQYSPISNYRSIGYRRPAYIASNERESTAENNQSIKMLNDFTSLNTESEKVEEPEEIEEFEELEEFDAAFLSELEKSHRQMGGE